MSENLQELIARKNAYLTAEAKVLNMQSHSTNNKAFVYAQLSEIRAAIKEIDQQISLIKNGSTTLNVTFRRP